MPLEDRVTRMSYVQVENYEIKYNNDFFKCFYYGRFKKGRRRQMYQKYDRIKIIRTIFIVGNLIDFLLRTSTVTRYFKT